MAGFQLKSVEFRRERQAAWKELEDLVARVERGGVESLGARELHRLPALYRAALSSLSVARAISLDRNVLDYLESLACRAYFCVYGSKQRARATISSFLLGRLPAAFRRLRWHVALAAMFLVLGTAAGLLLTLAEPDRFYSLVGEEMAQGRTPAASTDELREALYGGAETEADWLVAFATFLFTHNAEVGMLAFALGFVAGVPTFLLLFANGLTLGAFAALYHARGLSLEFWAWVLPHGVTELLAIVLCGGAGLAVAESLVFPGRYRRLENLARRGREAAVLVLGAVILLFVAGLIEGIFRQTVSSVPIRCAVAAGSATLWAAYFGLAGRGSETGSDTGAKGETP